MSRRLNRNGFTLLEVLIALFIFTIVAVIMTHALQTIFNSQAGTEKRAKRLAELQMANLILERVITQTIDRPVMSAKDHLDNAFIGSTSQVALTHGGESNPDGIALRSTLQRSSFIIEKNNLVREVFPVLDQTSATQSHRRVLLTDVMAGHFDFLDAKGVFHNTWPPVEQDKSAALPIAVRITLKLKDWGDFTQLYLIAVHSEATTHA